MNFHIRKAIEKDINNIEKLYVDVTKHLEENINYTGWKTNIYPVREDAVEAVELGNLYIVLKENNDVVGSFILKNYLSEEYKKVKWLHNIDEKETFVISTFMVSPKHFKQGIGVQMLEWIIKYSREERMKSIRLDVYEKNVPAINLYERLGFTYIDTISLGLEDVGLDWFLLYEKIL